MTVTTTGPFTLTPPAPTALPLPQSGGALGWLVLDNLTAFLLRVSVGAQTYYQAPLVEQVYDLRGAGGQPIQVTGLPLPEDTVAGITSGTLAPTWYSADETLPNRNWPIALSGPAEIAAATAAAILETGVPNVLTEVFIGTELVPNLGTLSIDVHQYDSVRLSGVTGAGTDISYTWSTTGVPGVGAQINTDVIGANATLPVMAGFLILRGLTASVNVNLYGSNRPAPLPDRAYVAGSSNQGLAISTGSHTMVANTVYPMTVSEGQLFQGEAIAYVHMSDATVTGYFQIILYDGTVITITDTNELSANVAGIGRSRTVALALPPNMAGAQFTCITAGGPTTAAINLIPV